MAFRSQIDPMLTKSLAASHQLLLLLMMMMMLPCCRHAAAHTFLLEAEQYVKDRVAYPRTAASGIWAVHFYENETFRIQFCVQSNTNITVTNVRYSNDGGEDHVGVRLDDRLLGSFRSVHKATSQDEWNQFENSGQIGDTAEILAGRHTLELLFVSADHHGIEIDVVAMNVSDEEQEEGLLQCTAYCDDSIRYTPTNAPMSHTLPAGRLVQRSHRTMCAEEQNVKMELYHPGLASYSVTSHYPRYRTLLDNQHEDLHHCQDAGKGRVLWLFGNFDLLPSAQPMSYKDSAVLSFNGNNAARIAKLTVRLSLAFADSLAIAAPADHHAILRLKFRRTRPSTLNTEHEIVHVILAEDKSNYFNVTGGMHRSTDPSKSDNEVSWVLSTKKGIFLTGDTKFVLNVVHKPFGAPLHVNYLRLEIHSPEEERFEVYKDNMTKVEGVRTRSSLSGSTVPGMALYRPDNQSNWNDTQAVIVLKKIPWSETTRFEEIFRLDQDGTLRLKPRSAYASPSPPYGTTVVIGPSDPNSSSPAAPLSEVDVDPWALKFTLTYVDSSVSEVLVRSTGDSTSGTRATMTHKRWASSSSGWPVAVVRSMWVADGKADIDHVSAAGKGAAWTGKKMRTESPKRVVDGAWREMSGTTFAFFRRCVSRHNTQAPDLTLDLLQDHHDLYH